MCYQAGHTGDVTAPGTWAPEQNCPSLVCLLLKRGTHHCSASLIHSQAVFCYLQQPSLRFCLLSSLSFMPFFSQSTPNYLLNMHLCLGHCPVAGQMRVAHLCKSPHTHTHHQSHVWFIPGINKTSVKLGYWPSERQIPILSGGEITII